jgi:hypothetical protein
VFAYISSAWPAYLIEIFRAKKNLRGFFFFNIG